MITICHFSMNDYSSKCKILISSSRQSRIVESGFSVQNLLNYLCTACQVIPLSVQSSRLISYHIILYHIIPCQVVPCRFISSQFISYHIISYHIISCNIISYHIISYQVKSSQLISVKSYQVISYHIISTPNRRQIDEIRKSQTPYYIIHIRSCRITEIAINAQ